MIVKSNCPALSSVENKEPFEHYKLLRSIGPVVWDGHVNAWLATSYDACHELLRQDKVAFRHPDIDATGDYVPISGGMRQLKFITGEEHRELHSWWLKVFSPQSMDALRPTLLRNITDATLERFSQRGKSELLGEFCNRIPIRVVLAVFDLPWQDEVWVERAKGSLDAMLAFFNKRFSNDPEVTNAGLAAAQSLREMLNPYVEKGRKGEGADLISRMWRECPDVLKDFSENDAYSLVINMLLGGADTSASALANALYILLGDAGLFAEIRTADDAKLSAFVEECLRIYPPVQFRQRCANVDTELAGQAIRKDDWVVPLLASSNRDESHYREADCIDLGRKPSRDHVSFNFGPRSCVGAGLARAEINEALRRILQWFPDLRFDPAAKAPSYEGLVLRAWGPLHVLFTPTNSEKYQ